MHHLHHKTHTITDFLSLVNQPFKSQYQIFLFIPNKHINLLITFTHSCYFALNSSKQNIKCFCEQRECLLAAFFQVSLIFKSYFHSKKANNSNRAWMRKTITVSMTGFSKDPNQYSYKNAMKSLNIRFTPNLSEQTDVLIVNDVTTEKYKIAKSFDVPICCVSIDWLRESNKSNKILPTLGFQIKKLFFGAHIRLAGFDSEKANRLTQKIRQNGGFAKIMIDVNEILAENHSRQEKINVIITTKENFKKLSPYLDIIRYPIVDVEWVEDSFRNKFCKYPFDYALNQTNIDIRQPVDHLPKMKKRLEAQLAIDPLSQAKVQMFENCFIYISSDANIQLSSTLKKLIVIFGGYYLEEISPAATHILLEAVTDQELYELKVYGALINILRIEWLIDSIYISKKMKEEDYFIRSCKPKRPNIIQLQERPNNISFNSMTFSSFSGSGLNVSVSLNSRKSISIASKTDPLNLKQKQIKVVKQLQSTIFKNYNFYIESTQKKEIQLWDLINRIIKNAGYIYQSRAQIKKGHCFYVMKDSLDTNKMIQQLKRDTKGQSQIQAVSYPWVKQCLTKTQFIDLAKNESFVYKPFNFKTPIHNFHKLIFQVLGLDDVMKKRLKELYNVLGSAKNLANRAEITHCLCGKSYQQAPKYNQIKKENLTVKFVSWKWLVQCANKGKIAQLQDYYMEKESLVSTQQSQNCNLPINIATTHSLPPI